MKSSSVTGAIVIARCWVVRLMGCWVPNNSATQQPNNYFLRNPQEPVTAQRLAVPAAAARDVHADRLAALQSVDDGAEVGCAVDLLALHFADHVTLGDACIAGRRHFLHSGDDHTFDGVADAVKLARLRRDPLHGNAEAVRRRTAVVVLRILGLIAFIRTLSRHGGHALVLTVADQADVDLRADRQVRD